MNERILNVLHILTCFEDQLAFAGGFRFGNFNFSNKRRKLSQYFL
jgi:hypothetical protein